MYLFWNTQIIIIYMKEKLESLVQNLLPLGFLFFSFILGMLYKFQNKMLYLPVVG